MGLWSLLTGKSSEKVLDITEKATDGLVAGLDKVFYTDEEKADTAIKRAEIGLKVADVHIKLMETLGSENTVRSITRRYLALMIVGVFLLLLIFSAAIWKFDPEWAKHVFSVACALSTLAGGVGIFYFGYYGVKETVKTLRSKL